LIELLADAATRAGRSPSPAGLCPASRLPGRPRNSIAGFSWNADDGMLAHGRYHSARIVRATAQGWTQLEAVLCFTNVEVQARRSSRPDGRGWSAGHSPCGQAPVSPVPVPGNPVHCQPCRQHTGLCFGEPLSVWSCCARCPRTSNSMIGPESLHWSSLRPPKPQAASKSLVVRELVRPTSDALLAIVSGEHSASAYGPVHL